MHGSPSSTHQPRPTSSGLPYHSSPVKRQSGNSPPPLSGSPSYYNGTTHQYRPYLADQRSTAPSTINTQNAAPTPMANRLPSPVFNRPQMSPTQGNMDVGPLAGVPQNSAAVPSSSNGPQPVSNGVVVQPYATPQQSYSARPTTTQQTPVSRTPNYPLSGLSPQKQKTPQPMSQTSTFLHSTSPSANNHGMQPPTTDAGSQAPNGPHQRTVSGTPILPPVEQLRPSPQQLRNSSSSAPVPTPSKSSPPLPQGEGSFGAQQSTNQQALASNAAANVNPNNTVANGTLGVPDTETLPNGAPTVPASHPAQAVAPEATMQDVK
jgi:hypothetical protein